MSDAAAWRAAVRRSHDRLSGLMGERPGGEVEQPSACSEWTVAQVLSHLGSQAEIFSLFLDAGLSGGDPPSGAAFGPIWDTWNARSPQQQVADSLAANEAFVSRLESLGAGTLDAFRIQLFGRDLDAAGLLRMRLSEHAVHTWDVAVAFDPSAVVADDAVQLLVGGLGETAARSGRPPSEPLRATITTSAPDGRFAPVTGADVLLEPLAGEPDAGPSVELAAEALVRLVYGRLDDRHPAHGPVHAEGIDVADLQAVFPGF